MAIVTACALPVATPQYESGAAAEAGGEKLIIGALHVGSISDAGYNQAHHAGLVAIRKICQCRVDQGGECTGKRRRRASHGKHDPTGARYSSRKLFGYLNRR